MKVVEQTMSYLIERTVEDEGKAYPHYIWRDQARGQIVVTYTDLEGRPSLKYKRTTDTPIIRNTVDPVTFGYKMEPGYEWEVWVNGAPTVDTFFITCYLKPEYQESFPE